MSYHNAVVTTAVRAPLSLIKVPTAQPIDREVLLHVEWTASTPLELHQADGGLFVKHPFVMGSNLAGTIVKVGPKVQNLVVGNKVRCV
jgi:NADPH:quinone reductase-like Zn-dependent oxidoreductase